jgi:O-antigen ligase
MAYTNTTLDQYVPQGRRLILLLALVLTVTVSLGALAAQSPTLAIAAAVAALLSFVIIAWPDVSTLAVVFLIYSNLAVVAVKFHNVPYAIGSSVPALLIIPLASYLIVKRQKLVINPVLPFIFLYLVIHLVSTLFSEHLDIAVTTLVQFAIEGFGLYFLINNLIRTPKMLRRVVWALLIAGMIMGGVPIYQQLTGTFENNYGGLGQTSVETFSTGVEDIEGEIGQYRLAGTIGEQNRYAQVMLMLMPLAFFQIWGERSYWLRILAAAATGIIIMGGALAFSRGAAVGFVLLLVIVGFMGYIKPYQIAIILAGMMLVLWAVPQYGNRLNTLQALPSVADSDTAGIDEADSSTQSRVTEMLAAGLVFVDYPLLGVGPGAFGQYYEEYGNRVGIRVKSGRTREAHSLYPEIAAELGGFGLVCFLAIVVLTLRNLALARKRWLLRRPELAYMATGFMLAIVSYMMTGIFLHMSFIRFFWLMMALAGAASTIIAEADTPVVAVPDKKIVPGSLDRRESTL